MTPAPLPLSCYIRTLNEERIIGRCIEAARQVAAEVVIVDSGSTDRTVEIAESLGARVFRQPWLGNGGQKRCGEQHCRFDWLLDLDADEVVSPELAGEIRALFAAGEPKLPVHEMCLVTVPPLGTPWYGFWLSYRRKLYDRRVVRMPDHKAWDQLEVPAGISVGRLKGGLLHYSFRDIAHIVQKLNRVSTVRAREGNKKSQAVLALRIVFGLPFYFCKPFILKQLWRAGIYGVALAGVFAFGRWLRDVKMYEDFLVASKGTDADRP